MKPIRTPKGKLYGMLDVNSNILHIKDRGYVRLIQIPPGGLTLQLITGDGEQETFFLPQQVE